MADNFITLGGVKLRKSEVATYKTSTVATNQYGGKEQVYVVEFKNGIKATYRGAQNNSTMPAYISSKKDVTEWTNTEVWGVMGLELKGTNTLDKVDVTEGSIIGIDVSGDKYSDQVTINRSKVDKRNPSLEFYAGDRGRINVDKYDNTEILQFGDSGKASYTKDGIPYHGIYRAENK